MFFKNFQNIFFLNFFIIFSGSVADGASKVMVVLLINDEAEDEASQEVSHEMKRQFFHKIQEFQLGCSRKFLKFSQLNLDEQSYRTSYQMWKLIQ